jgi:uncharacterized glyoxalase superfamily protein PhnB
MSANSSIEPPRIFPALRYKDAPAMIDWLEKAFGFERHVVYEGPGGMIAHAQLALGSAMIMLGSARDDEFAAMVGEPGGKSGQAIYVVVDDADAHFARAKAAGAEIVTGLTDQDYGSRDYICRDPEGYLWCFGTYWPKAHEAPAD